MVDPLDDSTAALARRTFVTPMMNGFVDWPPDHGIMSSSNCIAYHAAFGCRIDVDPDACRVAWIIQSEIADRSCSTADYTAVLVYAGFAG